MKRMAYNIIATALSPSYARCTSRTPKDAAANDRPSFDNSIQLLPGDMLVWEDKTNSLMVCRATLIQSGITTSDGLAPAFTLTPQ